MIGVPERSEAAPYYFTYIDGIKNPDITRELEMQLEQTVSFFRGVSD
jgi:hypothetical protein